MRRNESFSGCLVDGDADAVGSARRLRGKALAASLILEAMVLVLLLLWPLLAPPTLTARYNFTPTPPYGGHADPHAGRPHPQPAAPTHAMPPIGLRQPPIIPSRVDRTPDANGFDAQAALDTGGNGNSVGLSGEGPGIPGGLGPALPPPMPAVEPPHPPKPPVKVSEGVMEAMLTHRVQPLYPRLAVPMHLSGRVELHAIIGADGRVRQIEVVSGNPILARAAVEAVSQWRYRPTLLSGSAVEVDTLITVNFVLE